MQFTPLALPGAFLITADRHTDARGYFSRVFCREEFLAHGLQADIAQCSVSYTAERGTLRGLHYQHPPHAETKIVRCLRGALFDVVIDLRAASPTYLRWEGVALSPGGSMLYIPAGMAHGFLTMADETEVWYQMSAAYYPAAEGGIRWDDSLFAIAWPEAVRVISDKDAQYADYIPEPPIR